MRKIGGEIERNYLKRKEKVSEREREKVSERVTEKKSQRKRV